MSDFLVAYFHTQSEAFASVKQLLAHGLRRERVSIRIPGKPAIALDGTEAILSSSEEFACSGNEERPRVGASAVPAESAPPGAGTVVAVTLKGYAFIVVDVCLMLKDAGAYLIDVTEQNAIHEYSDT